MSTPEAEQKTCDHVLSNWFPYNGQKHYRYCLRQECKHVEIHKFKVA
jgi:hypothetical protein